jgi:hypothetical protein
MTGWLLIRRNQFAALLLVCGGVAWAVLLSVLIWLAAQETPGTSIVSLAELFFIVKLTGIALFVALVFGGWKIAWFALRNPPARRGDTVYLFTFSIWIVWTLLGAGSLVMMRA